MARVIVLGAWFQVFYGGVLGAVGCLSPDVCVCVVRQGMPGRVFKFMTPEFQTDVARLDQTLFLRRVSTAPLCVLRAS
jgi:hypothetical protein